MEIIKEQSKARISCHVLDCKHPLYFHWHEKYELCRLIDDCDFLIDGVFYSAHKGDIIAIAAQAVHKFIIKGESAKVHVMQFPISTILSFDMRPEPLTPHIKREDIEKIPSLSESIDFFFSIIDQNCPCTDAIENPFLRSTVSSLYFLLARHFTQEENDIARQKSRRDFYKIVEHINTKFSEDISVQSIADSLYISRGKVSSIFLEYSGASLTDYLRSVRIKNVNMMINQGYSITEAAYASGFQNTRTFNNAYKRVMGITPTEYTYNKKT